MQDILCDRLAGPKGVLAENPAGPSRSILTC